jgi:hypothetical protein
VRRTAQALIESGKLMHWMSLPAPGVFTRAAVATALFTIAIGAETPRLHGIQLRGTQLGDTCEHALRSELALGSHPKYSLEEMQRQNVVMVTDTSVAGQTKEIFYHCADTETPGIISSYSISIAAPDETKRRALYAEAKAAIVALLGEPTFDSDKLNPAQKARMDSLPLAPAALSRWENLADEEISVAISQPISRGDPWSVATYVSDPHLRKYNKS